MDRRMGLWMCFIAVLLTVMIVPVAPARAQEGAQSWTSYQINMRTGPSTGHPVVTILAPNTPLVLEGRNGDTSWVLGHTEDGAHRGWVATLYLGFQPGFAAFNLPLSDEIVPGPAQPAPGPSAPAAAAGGAEGETFTPNTAAGFDGINMARFDVSSVAGIDLAAVPIIGQPTGRARAIFQQGRALGNNPNVVAKVGDCSSEHWYFLSPFTWGDYNLGSYGDLQDVVNHFGASMDADSQATHNGYNVNTVQSPDWANPNFCRAGESPLECEYRLRKPSVAIIMFGTSDLLSMSPYEFEFYYRFIIERSIELGVIPVLSTFPGNLNFWNHTILYNKIVVKLAREYDVPLMNLWLALESVPNHGLELDGFHLGEPLDDPANLEGPNLQTGYPMRNLVTLQTLDAIWRGVMR